MIQLFKIGSADRLVMLLGFFLLLHLPYLIFNDQMLVQELLRIRLGERLADGWRLYAQVLDETAPLSALLYAGFAKIGMAGFRIFRLTAAILIWFQALWLNRMALRFNLVQDRNYLIALFYLILVHSSADSAILSPVLIGLCFFLPALGKLFRILRDGASADDAMMLGLWIGLAAACHQTFLIFLLPVIISALLFSSLRLNQYLILVAACLLPFLFFYTAYLYQGGVNEFLHCMKAGFQLRPSLQLCSMKMLLLSGGILFVICIAGWMVASRHSRVNSHRIGLIVFLFSAIAASLNLFTGTIQSTEKILFLLPMAAFLLAQLSLQNRTTWINELLGIVFFLLITTGFYQQTNSTGPWRHWNEELFMKEPPKGFTANFSGKKLLLLSNDFRYYRQNPTATRFFKFYMSHLNREYAKTYQGLIYWYQCLGEDPPEIIYDPDGIMNEIALRIPEFRECYQIGFYPVLYEAVPGKRFGSNYRK